MAKSNPLLTYRQANNLTQKQVAKRLRCSRSLIDKIESGGTVTAEMAVLMERRLGIERNEFRPDLWEKVAA